MLKQAIRSFTIDRKNFVCIESSTDAKASTIIYSLVETAKANYLNVYEYFELLLTKIPKHMNDTDLSTGISKRRIFSPLQDHDNSFQRKFMLGLKLAT